MENEGFMSQRIQHNPRERAFAEEWERENCGDHIPATDYGCGTLQNLFLEAKGPEWRLHGVKVVTTITRRDRFIVATVIQWLGSNVGFSFLQSALQKCGYKIVKAG